MNNNETSIKGNPLVDVQRSAIGHRATWTGLTYTKAREAGQAEEAEKFIREAIWETGGIHGGQIKSRCINPDNVACFADAFLSPTLIKSFEVEFKTKTEDKLEMDFHHCPLVKAWQDLGFDAATCDKLCDMAMDGDRGIAKAMGFEFHLGDTIAKGSKVCQVSFYKRGK